MILSLTLLIALVVSEESGDDCMEKVLKAEHPGAEISRSQTEDAINLTISIPTGTTPTNCKLDFSISCGWNGSNCGKGCDDPKYAGCKTECCQSQKTWCKDDVKCMKDRMCNTGKGGDPEIWGSQSQGSTAIKGGDPNSWGSQSQDGHSTRAGGSSTLVNVQQCKINGDWGHTGKNYGGPSVSTAEQCRQNISGERSCNQSMLIIAPGVGCYCFKDTSVTTNDCTYQETGYATYKVNMTVNSSSGTPIHVSDGQCKVNGDWGHTGKNFGRFSSETQCWDEISKDPSCNKTMLIFSPGSGCYCFADKTKTTADCTYSTTGYKTYKISVTPGGGTSPPTRVPESTTPGDSTPSSGSGGSVTLPDKCTLTPAEIKWRMWGDDKFSCEDMQSWYQSCTNKNNGQHQEVSKNCPSTCAKAKGECIPTVTKPSIPEKCTMKAVEKSYRHWNIDTFTCENMQSWYQSCTNPDDGNHADIIKNCPATCAHAAGECIGGGGSAHSETAGGECGWSYGIPNFINTKTQHDTRMNSKPKADFDFVEQLKKGVRVVNGGIAEDHEYPWYVKLSMGCGGSIISRNWILTAAHCGSTGDRVNVWYSNNAHSVMGTMTNHPGWVDGGNLRNDISLVKLDKPLECGERTFYAITLADLTGFDLNGCATWLIGRGLTADGGSAAQYLREIQTRSWRKGNSHCKYSVTDKQFCSYSPTNPSEDGCQGDSGGPVFIDTDTGDHHHYVLVGDVSYGSGCGQIGGVNTNISSYKSWIKTLVPEAVFTRVSKCETSFHQEGKGGRNLIEKMEKKEKIVLQKKTAKHNAEEIHLF